MIGIDISKWNGKFNWNKAISQKVELVYIKASQGEWIDTKFKENSASCTIPYYGGYHFLDYHNFPAGGETNWGKKQAQFFLKTLNGWGNLVGVLDIEDMQGFGWKSIWLNSTLDSVVKIVSGFTEEYKKQVGKLPALYMSSALSTKKDWLFNYYWKNFTKCPLWVANYNSVTSPVTGAWDDEAIWQYSSEGDGVAFGNDVGNKFIDLNKVKNVNALLLKPYKPETKKWNSMTIEEKLDLLKSFHPNII